MSNFPIAVLVSGAGTNLQAIIDRLHRREGIEVVAVGSSRADAPALERAAKAGIPTKTFALNSYADRASRDQALAGWLSERGVELVVLAGFMELLSGGFVGRFGQRMINVHPALLPAFPGVGAIEQAIAYGVKVFGVTVHFVDAGVDTGPIIAQRAIELPDSVDSDAVRSALRPLEHELLCNAIRTFARGELEIDPSNARRVLVRPSVGIAAGSVPE